MKFYQHKRQKAAVAIFCSLISSSAFAATYTYVGRWQIQEGPLWFTAGLGQTNGREAAAIKFGGSASDYVISTVSSDLTAINFKAYYVGWGVGRTLLDDNRASTGLYDCGSIGCSYSAWVSDRRVDEFNYAFLVNLGPSSSDTQSSLTTLSKSLRSSFNATLMSSNYANMNTYDCNLFDKNNMCISAGGRITTIDNPSSHHSAAVVVLGHKISPHIRIGGFLDQSVNHNMQSGVDMSNKNPMAGAFLVWNHQADGLGLQMKLANAYLDKDVTTSRAVVGTSEAGRGRTDLNTQSYVGELSYTFNYQEQTLVRPYFALRYTRIKQDGYKEETTAAVTAPLTYAKLSDRSTSAVMGVKVNHALTPKTNLTASLGVEQDLDHKSDQLTATGVSGLTSENFSNNIRYTRPVLSFGAYYAVAKNQRLSGDIYYQQLPFQSTDSATAYLNYTIGF